MKGRMSGIEKNGKRDVLSEYVFSTAHPNEHCPSERKDCFSWETFQNTFTELFVLAKTTVKSRRKKNSKPNM